jgi:osmotically-inducible protein OsmY
MRLPRWIGGLLVAASFACGAAAQPPGDFRAFETGVELGWMADPITFPYELRAYLKNGVLEVHGHVPNVIVRKQALNIARVYGAAEVVDHTEMVEASAKDFTAAPKEWLEATIRARIARGLPQLAATVHVQCNELGGVVFTGTASTQAEKVVLSAMLRPVPGCSQVDNRVQIGAAPAANVPAANVPAANAPAANTPVTNAPVTNVPTLNAPGANVAAPAPVSPSIARIRLARPDEAPPPDVSAVFDRPVTNERTEAMRGTLAKLCPQATGMYVYQVGPRRFQIQFTARHEDDATALAMRIFDYPEWGQFHLDVGAHVPR